MYTQEIICPNRGCGKLTRVNVLDVKGKTSTPCQHCRTRIYVTTDKNGKVIEIDSCVIVTACVQAHNLQEGQRVLTTIRNFRDNYIRNQAFGEDLLNEYYSVAPQIVLAITEQEDPATIWDDLYHLSLIPITKLIDANKGHEAIELYKKTLCALRAQHLKS